MYSCERRRSMEIYPHFYVIRAGEEVEYNELVCPKCETKADKMHDEADTVLNCPCGVGMMKIL
jgi:hypothetical protein